MSVILDNTYHLYNQPAYPWLGRAYRRAQGIELLIDIFQELGAFRDEELFVGLGETTNPEDVRRYLRTVFLASELCSLQPRPAALAYIKRTAPPLVTYFLLNILQCSLFLFSRAQKFIRQWDTVMGGVEPSIMDAVARDLPNASLRMAESILRRGPSTMVDLFCTRHPTYVRFVRAWRLLVFAKPKRGWGSFSSRLMSKAAVTALRRVSDVSFMRGLGQLGVFDMNIRSWGRAVPDEDAWQALMVGQGWARPLPSLQDISWRLRQRQRDQLLVLGDCLILDNQPAPAALLG